MPKSGNRGANIKKADAPPASINEDIDSNVIFGDAKTKKKAKQGSTTGDAAQKGGDNVINLGHDVPKKPDTRKLVSNIQKLKICLLREWL